MEKKLFMLASSHMDREWYLPMDPTRVFFAHVLDRALELLERLPDFRFFTDGQTSVIMDYLQIRPDRLQEIRRYVAEGRLQVGPWHVQSDERIPAGESHIRNLLLGKRECDMLGGRMELGYLPDDFGHLSQTPQILSQFGLDRAFLMRGVDNEKWGREFFWQGADGSRVFAISAVYGDACFADFEHGLRDGIRMMANRAEFEEKRQAAFTASEVSKAPYALMLINSDCQTLPKDLDELGGAHMNTFDEVFDFALKYADRYPTLKGELGFGLEPLRDTLASRVYLKTENVRAQSLLARFAEPLSCMTEMGNRSYRGLMDEAWKYLVENHTHDGITGCHCDRTADEIMTRFAKCEGLAEQVADFAMEDLSDAMDTSFAGEDAVCVFHPQAQEGSPLVPFSLRLDREKAKKYIRLFDENGREMPLMVTDTHPVGSIRSNKRAQQMFTHMVQYDGLVRLYDLPAMGMKTLRPGCTDEMPVYSGVTADEHGAENALIRLNVENGRMTITDKRSGMVYHDVGIITDCGNAGDAYHFEAVGEAREVACEAKLLRANGAMAQFEFTGRDVRYVATLTADDPAVYVRCEMDNHDMDHALFASFSTGMADAGSFRDQPFVEERGEGGVQPTTSFCGCRKDGKGIAVLHKGLHRAEFTGNGSFRLTLLQAQGRLYGGFFPDEHNDEFLGGEMLRKVTVEYAILPLSGGEDLFERAAEFVDGVRFFKTAGHAGKLPSRWSYMEIGGCRQTAVKREEKGDRMLVRLSNPTAEEQQIRIRLPKNAKRPVWMRLDETEMGPCDTQHARLRPFEIATLAFEGGNIL